MGTIKGGREKIQALFSKVFFQTLETFYMPAVD
jgi:hypothetical protein